ncbi:hypothetical protein [Dactylosporangium sp. NPDC050588]|uniref:hypothetical protein n=1 Tax=Dactylosporangium sp. NPDC050588 TaxID=3157211 RepID=UPI0033FF9951
MTGKRAKRAKRTVESGEFDAFARRILRAYARRVAAGDIEALAGLAMLSSEVDTVVREAVRGLRAMPYRYSWDEIGSRLGVSRQAVQMRYGDKTDRSTLDRRLTESALTVTVSTLVDVLAEHYPGSPIPSVCPGCGFRYPDGSAECPSLTTVRPLLFSRRAEDQHAVSRLTGDQLAYLRNPKKALQARRAVKQVVTSPVPAPDRDVPTLFDLVNGKG